MSILPTNRASALSRVRLAPLESGDRLTRWEFEQRYSAMPGVKAELVEGVVYMASPVRSGHSVAHSDLIAWLGVYRAMTAGVLCSDNGTIRLDEDNEPQPDATLFIHSKKGTSKISSDDYLEGSPEFVAEVAASSASIDTHMKKAVYRRNRIQEYLVWRVNDGEIDWYSLEQGTYVPLKAEAGVIKSLVFPGLWLAVEALLAGDLAGVIATMQTGIASPEHAAFVKQIADE